jgi:hypothetical protein
VSRTYRATLDPDGNPRPFVPFEMTFRCQRCARTEHVSGNALIDSGAPFSLIPSSFLPRGHVEWDDLRPQGTTARLMRGDTEYREWNVRVTFEDVPIVSSWRVMEGSTPAVPVFGMGDFFTRYKVAFDWGHVPPLFYLEPYGGSSEDPAMESIPLRRLALMDYGHTTFGVPSEADRPALRVPEARPALE